MTETNASRLGEVLRDGSRVGLRYERRLSHPPDKVWRVLTESSELRHWFPADIIGERRAGAPLRLTMWPESVERAPDQVQAAGMTLGDPTLPGEIRAWDPPRLFEFTWDSDVLRWELSPEGGGTRLLFTTWVSEPTPVTHADIATGYHVCLDDLEAVLATGAAPAHDDGAFTELRDRYEELLESI
jgi:uncharacterized protein YndB with AHSA1/START domain